jgi:hypothetical protein
VKCFGLSFAIAVIAKRRDGTTKQAFRGVKLSSKTGNFGAIRQGARVCFERGRGQCFSERSQQTKFAGSQPVASVLADYFRGAVEILSL